MQEEFDLEVILSFLTGARMYENLYKIDDLVCFILEREFIETKDINEIFYAKNHIYKIHPELLNVKYDETIPYEEWIKNQIELFGNELTISVLGEPIIKLKKQSRK